MVDVGSGVMVGVGGNHTIVAVGVWVGGGGVSVGNGVRGSRGIQAAAVRLISPQNNIRNNRFMRLVYYRFTAPN